MAVFNCGVAFGSIVRVKDLSFDDEEEFTLVGAGEEDYDTGKILITSPLAQVTLKVSTSIPSALSPTDLLFQTLSGCVCELGRRSGLPESSEELGVAEVVPSQSL